MRRHSGSISKVLRRTTSPISSWAISTRTETSCGRDQSCQANKLEGFILPARNS